MQTISTTLPEKMQAIRNCPYFAGLEDEHLYELTEGMHLAHYERGEVIFWQDEPCRGLRDRSSVAWSNCSNSRLKDGS